MRTPELRRPARQGRASRTSSQTLSWHLQKKVGLIAHNRCYESFVKICRRLNESNSVRRFDRRGHRRVVASRLWLLEILVKIRAPHDRDRRNAHCAKRDEQQLRALADDWLGHSGRLPGCLLARLLVRCLVQI